MITTNYKENNLELCAKDMEYISSLENRLTLFGQLPYSVPKKMMIECIKMAGRLFFDYYNKGQYTTYFSLKKKDIEDFVRENEKETGPLKVGARIKIHPRVRAISNMYILNDNKGSATSQELVNNILFLQHTAGYQNDILGINANMYILEAAAKMQEEAVTQAVFGKHYPYHFNPLSHDLILFDKITNLVFEAKVDIHLSDLYSDSLFDRYCYGICKRELKRLLASHTIPLPGDVTLNPDEICNNLEDIENVEQIVKAGSGIGDIILFR